MKGIKETEVIVSRIIMNALPEKQKEILQTLLSLIGDPEEAKDALNYGIFSDIEDQNIFNLISEWETRRHLDDHIQSDKFSVLLGTKSLLVEPLKIQIFTISDAEGMEAVNAIRKQLKPIYPI